MSFHRRNSKNTDGRDCFFTHPFPHTTNDKHLNTFFWRLVEGQAAVVVMLGVNVEKLHEFISQDRAGSNSENGTLRR
jgi:hypothetical protein